MCAEHPVKCLRAKSHLIFLFCMLKQNSCTNAKRYMYYTCESQMVVDSPTIPIVWRIYARTTQCTLLQLHRMHIYICIQGSEGTRISIQYIFSRAIRFEAKHSNAQNALKMCVSQFETSIESQPNNWIIFVWLLKNCFCLFLCTVCFLFVSIFRYIGVVVRKKNAK